MLKKIKAILTAGIFFAVSVTSYALAAEQSIDTETGTVSGTPDKYVEVLMDNSTINYGTFAINDQKSVDDRSDASGKYVIFDSLKLAPAQSIGFNEGASNSNIFAKVTYTGETYPASGGLDSSKWLFVKDSAGTNYVQSQIKGSLSNGGGGVIMPPTVTEVGSLSTTFIYYTSSSSGSGTIWTRNSKTIYVALGTDARLYVSDNADLSSASYYTVKGEAVNTPFYGNYFIETGTFPNAATDAVTLDFGYRIDWDATQANTKETFSTLIDLPMHAAYNHNWTWNLSVISEYFSAP